jgi:peptidoglycan/LPS O-acetylase OafA/YrhL
LPWSAFGSSVPRFNGAFEIGSQIDPKGMSDHPAGRVPHRPEIDGLRALAVLPVILYHGGFHLFSGGYVGVDVFFVVSGFLITSIILEERRTGRFSVVTFYERRVRRILPALFLVMLICVPVGWVWMLPDELLSLGQSLLCVALFVSNVLFWRTSGYFDLAADEKPLLHTWSLGVEEQFYVVFPLLIALVWRLGIRRLAALLVLGGAASFFTSDWMLTKHSVASFFLAPTRAWELFAGSLLSVMKFAGTPRAVPSRAARECLGVLGLCLIVAPIFLYGVATPFPGRYALPPVIGTLLIIAFVTSETLVGRALTLRSMLWIGSISYSAYLWHQPLFAFARIISANHPPQLLFGALAFASLGLAHLSWKFVERPFRDRRNWSRRAIFLWALIPTVIFVGIGAAFVGTKGAPNRWSVEERRLLIPAKTRIEECPAVDAWLRVCRIGAPGRPPSIALLGDSHADAIASALDEALVRADLAGFVVHTDCHPVAGFFDSREPLTSERREHCAEADRRLLNFLAQPSVSEIVVAIRWTARLYPMNTEIDAAPFDNHEGGVESDFPYRRNIVFDTTGRWTDAAKQKAEALTDYIANLAALKPTLILYPVPEVGWTPPRLNLDAVAVGNLPPAVISTSWSRFKERNAAAEHILNAIDSPNLRRSRPEELLCNTMLKDRCVAQINGELYYADDDHLSMQGARMVINDVMRKLRSQSSRPAGEHTP